MKSIGQKMPFGWIVRGWFLAAVLAAVLTLAVACGNDPEPTSTPVPEPTATTAPTQAAATAVAPTATPEPVVEVVTDAEPLPIVATSNIVGEWVSIVGGDRVDVLNLVPRGVDPHGYQPGARDIARVADAEIVFAVGLSLEQEWLEDLIENAAADHEVVIELGQRIDPLEFSFVVEDDHAEEDEGMVVKSEAHGDEDEDADEGKDHGDENEDADEGEDHGDEDEDAELDEGEEHHDDEDEDAEGDEAEGHGDEDDDGDHAQDQVEIHHEDDGHDHGALDPHFWFDPERVIIAVRQVAKELREIDPDSTDYYNANRDEYIAKLTELDGWITDNVSAIDDHDRILVTTHDSFGYFAAKFGFEVAGVIIPGGGTELERSPQELAELVHEVEEAGASVVFAEAQLSDRLASTLAREAGIKIVGGLYTGSLGEDGSGAETYVDMMRTNVSIIVDALAE
ncbi:MAG: metal ABC transporter substrate-binding protein [Chloroflexi bacterium]|nr:metal ABC transporter substrate-binding protein [Chloroflexota bacterium]